MKTAESPRKISNHRRLIDAALEAIAERGYAAASVSEIIARAGLSRGMIHLHFQGKDALIAAAAKHASDGYYTQLDTHLGAAAPEPTSQIRAVVACDLSKAVMNSRTVGIWYELRGAARTVPAIAAHSDTRGGRLEKVLTRAFSELADGDSALAKDAMRGTIALLDGIWTDFMLHPDGYDAPRAERVIYRFLNGLFPGHFPGVEGLDGIDELRARLAVQFNPPSLGREIIAPLLVQEYGLRGDLLALDGEGEQTLRLDCENGQKFVVKVTRKRDAPGAAAFQMRALEHLAQHMPDCGLPGAYAAKDGALIVQKVAFGDGICELRVLDYAPGQPVADGAPPAPELAHDAGILLGCTAQALAKLEGAPPPAFNEWGIENGLLANPAFWGMGQKDIRSFEADLRPSYERLRYRLNTQRWQLIHGDAHLENLLRSTPDARSVCGLIDFGDMARAPLLCDAAILALGFAEDARDPSAMAAAAVAGYHTACPFTIDELDLIFDAMISRQALSVLLLDAKLSVCGPRTDALREIRAGLIERLTVLAALNGAEVTAAIHAACAGGESDR
ncbi:phosphotransferase [Roseovarius arcticus]|uniref:phosphotransferase n=1 Tax=Roseovarius arcticus TaxID=2547404 RepID=UPI0011107D1A|nr:phosphotransferase [Roseovarius arcticus]